MLQFRGSRRSYLVARVDLTDAGRTEVVLVAEVAADLAVVHLTLAWLRLEAEMAVAAVVTQIAHLVAADGLENARLAKQRRLVKSDGACPGRCSEIEAGTVEFRVLSERRGISFVGGREKA